MATHNTLTCLFGFHDYSKRLTKDKGGRSIHLCTICGRSGYKKWDGGHEVWRDYNEEGNLIHSKWNSGTEYWTHYDKKGSRVYVGRDDGTRQTQ